MDARFYNSEDIDIERLGTDLVNVYASQGYNAQQIGNKDQLLVQIKKGGDFEAIIGMQAALSITLQKTAGGVIAMIGKQKWIDKAAVGAVGIVGIAVLWPLVITAGVGAFRQASLGNQALNIVDGLVRQQRPAIGIGPLPAQIAAQIQQQWAPQALPAPSYVPPYQPAQLYQGPGSNVASGQPGQSYAPAGPVVNATSSQPSLFEPVSSQLRCANCNSPYEPGDTFCSGCGRALTTPRLYCTRCNSEVQAGAAFCPKCGASTFSTLANSSTAVSTPDIAALPTNSYVAPTQQAPVQPQPVYQPPVQPTTPAYTPPPVPPAAPAYVAPTQQTPAVQPQPTVYYVPAPAARPADADAPTVSGPPTTQRPAEPYYVPPVTQTPVAAPQPKVTIVPNTPKQTPPEPPRPRPQKQYYIPSTQAEDEQTATLPADVPTQAASSAPTVPASASESTKAWGVLTFGDGQKIQLTGEHAVIGRTDHDLAGMQPEVDLSKMAGADTISRIHAAIERSSSSYTITDLNSTNATRLQGKRLEPDKAVPLNDGDALQFGKISCTFHKV